MSHVLHLCPFCGDRPSFSEVESKDERRYMGMEINCCITMTEGIGWYRYRDMTKSAIKSELEDALAKQWNSRFVDEFSPATTREIAIAKAAAEACYNASHTGVRKAYCDLGLDFPAIVAAAQF